MKWFIGENKIFLQQKDIPSSLEKDFETAFSHLGR